MKRLVIILLTLTTVGLGARTRGFWEPKHPVAAELGMSVVGSAVAGVTSWGAYLLWGWGSKAVTPESWDAALETVGRVGLYGLGYGLLVPVGASSGVVTVGLSAGDPRPSWGALIGGYVGTAASLPFAVMVLDEPTWGRAALAAGSIFVLSPLCAWLGYRLTPDRKDDATSLNPEFYPCISADAEQLSVGLCLRF